MTHPDYMRGWNRILGVGGRKELLPERELESFKRDGEQKQGAEGLL